MNKRILIIYARSTWEVYNRQSAMGSYIHCLGDVLRKNGYEISINGQALDAGKTEMPETARSSGFGSILRKLVPGLLKEIVKHRRLFRNHQHIVDSVTTRFDHILEFYTYGSDVGYKLSRANKTDLFIVYDNPVLEEYEFFYGKVWFFRKRIENNESLSLLNATGIVAYSNAVRLYLDKKYKRTMPVFIHQNVDYSRFDFFDVRYPGTNPFNIGFIGSFLKWHRVDLLVDVFIRLSKEFPGVKLYLIGNGVEFKAIKELVENSGISSQIRMPGFLDGESLRDFKKELDIGVMPGSNWYGAPNKIFEYGAAGIAVVAPDTPTIRDLFSENEILLFKQDNAEDLYDKLSSYIRSSEKVEKYARVLQNKIREKYSEEKTFLFYADLLQMTHKKK